MGEEVGFCRAPAMTVGGGNMATSSGDGQLSKAVSSCADGMSVCEVLIW